MTRFPHILSFALAVIIALTAQSAAVARVMPDATGQMVICTGTGPLMVYTDENGDPTGAPHICPDCTMSLIVAVADYSVVPVAMGLWSREPGQDLIESHVLVPFGTPSARGPPHLI